ncbi:MAG: hypothetical protein R3C19_13785 [Planctomycetaceae bacterium]
MAVVRRRLTFQLTPLLDLLLIVIFAQYMEVQDRAESAQNRLQQQEADLNDRRAALQRDFESRQTALEAAFTSESTALRETRQHYSEQFQNILDQHQQVGNALAKALNLPGSVMEQILKLRTDGSDDDADRMESAVRRLSTVLESRGSDLMRFVIRFDEMQKHVTLWEIHIQDNGQARFSDGEQAQDVAFESTDEFAARAFEASKAFTEPKPLVIILLTYGDAQGRFRQQATEGMPLLVEQLRRDSGNTRWFDFSLMGFRPAGPLFDQGGRNNGR